MTDDMNLIEHYQGAKKVVLSNQLVETLQELAQRLVPMASAMEAGNTRKENGSRNNLKEYLHTTDREEAYTFFWSIVFNSEHLVRMIDYKQH